MTRLRVIGAFLICMFIVVFPFLVGRNGYAINVAILTGIWIILALGLDLVMGYTGHISLAHGAFYGIGAYSSALLTLRLGLSFWVSLLLAGLIAGVIGLFIGYPSLRTKGLYFAVTTLGVGIIINSVLENWIELTNGPMGLAGIASPDTLSIFGLQISFQSITAYYYLVFLIAALAFIGLFILVNLPVGKVLVAIREDEMLARSMGFSTTLFKVAAFVIASFLAGIAGSLYAHYVMFISPESFTFFTASFPAFVIVAVGGPGTLVGPIVGAIVLTTLPELLRMASIYRQIVYGAILLLVILVAPGGILGALNHGMRALGKRFIQPKTSQHVGESHK